MTARLQYIDRLKGISMVMVVIGHILLFCTLGYNNDFMSNIVMINMPLFFFLNGFVIRQIKIGGGKYLFTKFCQIIIPFLAWGAIISVFRKASYVSFFEDYWKFGYWYLLVLFEYYIVYFVCDFFIKLLNRKVLFTMLIYISAYVIFRYLTGWLPTYLNILIDYFQFVDYMPYFFLGIIVKQTPLIELIKKNIATYFTITTAFSIAFYILWNVDFHPSITVIGLRIFLILTILMVFMAIDSRNISHTGAKFVNNSLATIGRHTLSIYMLQFFFFRYINLHAIGQQLYSDTNYLGLLLLVTVIAVPLCYLCIAIEKLISLSPLFSTVLLGKKYA